MSPSMHRLFRFGFSLLAYASFGLSLTYLIGFLIDHGSLPVTVDQGPKTAAWLAAVIDVLLIGAFGLQHSIMARPWFKRYWTRVVPATIERSMYVLISSAATLLLCLAWRPIPDVVWAAGAGLPRVLWWSGFAIGFAVLISASFQIDHFELLGLKQSWSELRGRACRTPEFAIRGLYRLVRHPIYTGWLLLFWVAPTMTIGHLLLAIGMSLYVLVAIIFEERDLTREHGDAYLAYRERVPALLPRPARLRRSRSGATLARSVALFVMAGLLANLAGPTAAAEGADGIVRVAFESGGRERSSLLYVPAGDLGPRGIVVMLHGAGGDAERIRRFTAHGLEQAAEVGGWIVAYPLGVGGTWNDCRKSLPYPARRQAVDDVSFLVALIERLRARHSIAIRDVLVAGFSNGGQMAMRLAIEHPDAIGAIAVVAAQLPEPSESRCVDGVPALSSLWIKGTLDPFLPSEGGPSIGANGESLGRVVSISETVEAFLAPLRPIAAVTERELVEKDGNVATSVTMKEWRAHRGNVVRLYTLHGSGHVVPQSEVELPAVVGTAAGDLELGEAVLEFMALHQQWSVRSRQLARGAAPLNRASVSTDRC